MSSKHDRKKKNQMTPMHVIYCGVPPSLQLVPAMFGMFAYKAAALVQVYRDNEDLQFVFPDNEEGSND